MERLTYSREVCGIKRHYVSSDDCFDTWRVPQEFEGAAIESLAAYEDTGLTPEEIKRHLVMREVHGYRIAKLRPKKVEVFEEAQPGYGEKRNNSGEMLYRKRTVIDEYNHEDYCSICGKRLCSRFINYCPNCGAKMDVGE